MTFTAIFSPSVSHLQPLYSKYCFVLHTSPPRLYLNSQLSQGKTRDVTNIHRELDTGTLSDFRPSLSTSVAAFKVCANSASTGPTPQPGRSATWMTPSCCAGPHGYHRSKRELQCSQGLARVLQNLPATTQEKDRLDSDPGEWPEDATGKEYPWRGPRPLGPS